MEKIKSRQKKSIEEKLLKLELTKQERYEKTIEQYEKLKQKRIAKISEYYEKKKARRLAQIENMEKQKKINAEKKIRWQKIVKKVVKEKSRKQKCFDAVCYLSKIKRADNDWYVIQIDTWLKVKWNKCVWWHIYPKWKYPWMSLSLDNVRPISKWCNYRQLDAIWYDWIDKTTLTEEEKRYLSERSKDKPKKWEIIDKTRWEKSYKEILYPWILVEEKRLWIKNK